MLSVKQINNMIFSPILYNLNPYINLGLSGPSIVHTFNEVLEYPPGVFGWWKLILGYFGVEVEDILIQGT